MPNADELFKKPPDEEPTPPVNPTIANPYTRGLLDQGIRDGTLPPIDFAAEEAKRIATLKETVVPATQALLGRGLEESQRLYQKSGKLLSSSALYGPGGTQRTTEHYALMAGAQMAAGVGDIYSQLGAERGAERGRQTGAQIAAAQDWTANRIAEIERDTTLTGYEKQVQIARIQKEAGESVANIQSRTNIQITQLQEQTDLQIAEIQADTALTGFQKQIEIAKINKRSAAEVAKIRAAGDLAKQTLIGEQRLEEIEKGGEEERLTQEDFFDFYTDEEGTPQWMLQFNLEELTAINPLTGNPWGFDQFMLSLEENARQFDLTSDEGIRQFDANLQFMRDELNTTTAQAWAIFEKTLEMQLRGQDIDLYKFGESMDYAREKDWFDEKLARDLQTQALTHDAAIHNANTINGFTQWWGDWQGNLAIAGANLNEQHWYAQQVLAQNAITLTDNRMLTINTMMQTVMGDPVLAQLIMGVDSEGNIVDQAAADKFLGVLVPGLENMFFDAYDIDESGIIEDEEGVGVTYRTGDLWTMFSRGLGLPEDVVEDINSLSDFRDYVAGGGSIEGLEVELVPTPGGDDGDGMRDFPEDGGEEPEFPTGGGFDRSQLVGPQIGQYVGAKSRIKQYGYTYENLPGTQQAIFKQAVMADTSSGWNSSLMTLIRWCKEHRK